jgi:geranylgeranylglycerol-phosphate geranylgeranyltransferase
LKSLKAFFTIIRPLNCLITFFTIIIAAFICAETLIYKTILLAGFAGALVNAGGNIINDYFDIEIDRINRPQRPLPSGAISLKSALSLYLYLTLFAFAIIYNLSIEALTIVIVTSVMLFLYSYKLKGIPLIGNIVVAFFTGLAFLFGSIIVGNLYCGIIPMTFAFLISLMRELVKDIQDIEGDKAIGVSTFPIKYGIEKTIKLISVVGVILIISTTLPYLLKIYNIYYFIFTALFVNGILIDVIRNLKKDASPIAIKKASKLLKLGMVFGIIAILIGTKF